MTKRNHLPLRLPEGYMEALLERIDGYSQIDPSGCVLWTGTLRRNGYGVIGVGTKLFAAHALVYELTHGPIPDGYELHHTCGVKRCINPDHLLLVTHADHMSIHARKPRRPTKRRRD